MFDDLVVPIFWVAATLWAAWIFPALIIVLGLALGGMFWGWIGAILGGFLGLILWILISDARDRQEDERSKERERQIAAEARGEWPRSSR